MRTKLPLLLSVPRPFNSSLFYFRTMLGFKMLYLCFALIVLLHALVHEASVEGLHFKLSFSMYFRCQYGPMKSYRLYDDIFLLFLIIIVQQTIRSYNYLIIPGTAHQLPSSSRSRIRKITRILRKGTAQRSLPTCKYVFFAVFSEEPVDNNIT